MALKDYMERKPVIQTGRLSLRPLCREDVPALREWMPDKAMYAYWGKSPGRTDKQPELLFEKPEKPSKSVHLGIALNKNQTVIGELWVYLIENDRMGKLAVRIGKNWQGQGYATEAVRAMVEFCFTHTELKRLWTDVDVRNLASCRVLEKCGFTKEGTIRQGKMVSAWCDYHLYGILKEDVRL